MTEKKLHEDQKYIDGLLANNSFVIQSIYDKYAPKVIHYIRQNSGDSDQAQDIIQEVLIAIYHQAQNENLKLTCPFDAYFFLLCKRKWLNELKKYSNNWVTIEEEKVSITEDAQALAFETEVFEQKNQLFQVAFQKIGQSCKELLQAAFQYKSLEEVAEKLGTTYGYVRKRKSICIGKLTEIMQQSEGYKQIKQNI